nr:DUF2939 domain-containing protein [Microbulbifer sediminum]
MLAAAYVAMPWYTAHQLAETAHNREIEQFGEYLDLPALRANLKTHMQQRMRESMDRDVPPELSDFLAAGANLFLSPLLEGLVTAEGLAALLRGGDELWQFERDLYRPEAGRDRPAAGARRDGGELRLRRWGFTGVSRIAADYGAGDETELRLVLERQGLHWRVIDLRFPATEQHGEKSDEKG